jgi:hypothetical protein
VCSCFTSVQPLHGSAKSLVLLRLVAKAGFVCSCFTLEPPSASNRRPSKLLNLNICNQPWTYLNTGTNVAQLRSAKPGRNR